MGALKVKLDDGTWVPVGAQGPPGTPGSIWYSSEQYPDPGDVPDPHLGDMFVYTDTGDVYRYPGTGAFWDIQLNIKGEPGSQWISGTGVPAPTTGDVGDWWLNDANGDVYAKNGPTTWTLEDNLTGPPGATATAPTLFQTATQPTALAVGDIWIDTSGNY